MKPEWITAIVAGIGAIGAVLNLVVTLRMRVEVSNMRQEILDRVEKDYQRKDVCAADMRALATEMRRG